MKRTHYFLLGLFTVLLVGAKITTDNLKVGRKQAENITIEFDKGDANNPKIQWNDGSSAIQFSNDGANFFDMGSGSGGGSGGLNIVSNGDFESGTTDWTQSGGSFSDTTNTVELINGGKSGKFDSNGTGQTLETTKQNLPNKLVGNSCSVQISYRADTIAAGDYVLRVEDAADADVLPLNPDGNPWLELEPTIGGVVKQAFAAFICPDTAQMQIILESKVADAPEIIIDDAHLGSNIRAGVVDGKITPQVQVDLTNADFINDAGLTITGKATGQRVGDSLHLTLLVYYTGTGTDASALTFTVPSEIAAGVTIPTGFYGAGSTRADAAVAADKFPTSLALRGSGSSSLTFSENLSTSINGTAVGNVDVADIEYMSITAILPVTEWIGQGTTETVTLETQGWFAEGEIFGTTSISLVLGNVTSWAEATRNDLTLDLGPNSKPAQIACASGNPSTGLTCAAGNETMGVTIEAPYTGQYEVCFNINQDQLASTNIRTVWAVHETEETSLTILQEGLKRTYIGQGNTAGETRTVSGEPCGIFNISAGRHTFRALYMQQGSGVTASSVTVDRSATVGGRNLSFYVRPYTQNFPQAIALTDRHLTELNYTTGQTITNNTTGINLLWDTIVYSNNPAAYNAGTGIWTAPKSAIYNISSMVWLDLAASFDDGEVMRSLIKKNGSATYRCTQVQGITNSLAYEATSSCSVNTYLNSGDTIQMEAFQDSGLTPLTGTGSRSWLSISEQ